MFSIRNTQLSSKKSFILLLLAFTIFLILDGCGDDPTRARRRRAGGGGGDISASDLPCAGGGGGTPTKIIYVTDGTTDGLIGAGGIAAADAFCMADANRPASVTNADAFLTDGPVGVRIPCTTANCGGGPGEHVDWVLDANTQYTRTDGTVIGTTNANGIFSFPLTNSWNGVEETSYTGIGIDWTPTTLDCSGWTTAAGVVTGTVGANNSTTNTALNTATATCDTGARLICVQR